jgi:hypothetical protein
MGSSIDRLGFGQDAAAAYVIPARFNSLTVDQIDPAAQEALEFLLEIGESGKIIARRGSEGHQEVGIAAAWIKIGAARCGAKHFQPDYAVAAAKLGHFRSAFRDVTVHDNLRRITAR